MRSPVTGVAFRAAPSAPRPGATSNFFRIFNGLFFIRKENRIAPSPGAIQNNSLSLYCNQKYMNIIAVDELYKALAQARKAGMGSKKIMLSNDDEGNGYHECFFAVTTDLKSFGFGSGWAAGMLPYGVSPEDAENNYVIIG